MRSPSHWVEIDLLRGNRISRLARKKSDSTRISSVSRNDRGPEGVLSPIRLPQRLPVIPIPLKPGDPEARLDIQAVLDAAYDRVGYDLEIEYR